MARNAESYDLDGVIIERQIPIQAEALWRMIRKGSSLYDPPSTIPLVPRFTRDGLIMSPMEAISFKFQAKRHVIAGVKEFLEGRNTDKYGNTGRSNSRAWVEMTEDTLFAGDVLDQFNDIFFKPPGIKTIISKGAAIASLQNRYDHVTHFDDNPADVLGLATVFPDVQFVVVQDLTTGLLFSRVEMKEYPNVRRVAQLGDIG